MKDCIHHWILESPSYEKDGWSTGKCIKCKDVKRFNNVSSEKKFGTWSHQRPKAG